VEYARIGEGPVVLAAHGGPGGYDQGFILRTLAAAGLTVITPSRPGYLRTPLGTSMTFPMQADLFAALLDTLGIEKAAVIGFSAGGPVALQFALRHQKRCQALIMEAGVSQNYTATDSAEKVGQFFLNNSAIDVVMWLSEKFANIFPEVVFSQILKLESTFSQEQIDGCVQQLKQNPEQVALFKEFISTTLPLSLRKKGLDNDIKQFAEIPRYPLEKITAPTLIMHSPFDNDVPFSHAQFCDQTIANAELFAVDACGHFLWFGDDGEAVAHKRLMFLQEHLGVNAHGDS
jgi:pimeloyl-ACP methyl ester carboxylesterase